MLRPSEEFVQKEIREFGGLPEIDEAIEGLNKFLNRCYFKSKDIRLSEWEPDKGELYEVVLRTFTTTLMHPNGLTYQQIAGILAGCFPHDDVLDRVKTAAEVIAVIAETGLIKITRTGSGHYIMVSTEYGIEDIPTPDRHEIIREPIEPMDQNYSAEFGSLLLGGKQNFHTKDIRIAHLNRMNSIPLSLNKPLLRVYSEASTFELDTLEKENQWKEFVTESYRKYIRVANTGNTFYLNHKYDKRGRTYAEGYHITTQGSSFKKAVVQLANAEPVALERS